MRVVTEPDGETVHNALGSRLQALESPHEHQTEHQLFAGNGYDGHEIRPWPHDVAGQESEIGGEDAGEDLVIHYDADGKPWLWEIEHASRHPEYLAAALAELKRPSAMAAE